MKVTIARTILGGFDVHRAGCQDLKTRGKYVNSEVYHEDHSGVKGVVESFYGPEAGGFYEESGKYETEEEYANAWKDYRGEFNFLPCCVNGWLAEDEQAD